MAITKKVIYSIQDNEAVLNEDLVFYTNDEVILEITLKGIEYNADTYMINIITPDNEFGRSFPEPICSLNNTYYVNYGFSVSNKPGKYKIQIVLIESEFNTLKLPEFEFEVRQDITGLIEENEYTKTIVDDSLTDSGVLRSIEGPETYSETGYTSEKWYSGDIITAGKLNNMVNGIDEGIASAENAYSYAKTAQTTSVAALNGLNDKAWVGHTHNEYSPNSHTHTKAQITDFPTNLSEFTNDIGAGGSGETHTHTNLTVLGKLTTNKFSNFESAYDEITEIRTSGNTGTVYGFANERIDYIEAKSAEITQQFNSHIENHPSGASAIEPLDTDVPKVFFTSSDMLDLESKTDGEKMTEFEYISKTKKFKCYATVAIQGTSSASLPKKNYTVKLYKDNGKVEKEYVNIKGWGEQTKFCFKANYVDTTHTRNLGGARIAYDMVESRPTSAFKTELQKSPRNGVVDGFPIKVFVNGVFHGIYTWNIPKDAWTFNMNNSNPNHMVLCAEYNNDGQFTSDYVLMCEFRKLWAGSSWSVEAGTESTTLTNSFNRCVNFVMTANDADFKSNISQYFDLYSLLDYYCFSYLCCHYDGLAKNLLMATYDGTIWGASLYDMDSIFGANYNGSSFMATNIQCPEQYQETNSLLWQRIEQCFPNELYTRYKELRKGALSLGNIVAHVEQIYDLISDRDISEEQIKWIGLPSKSTNRIKRFREYMNARATYVDTEMEVIGLGYIDIDGITLNKSNTTINVGSTDTIIATISPTNATNKNVIWSSDNEGIATVVDGVVTGIASGSCVITAKTVNGNYTETCNIVVNTVIVDLISISLNKSTSTLEVGANETLSVIYEPTNATNKNVIWSSNNEGIATVVDGVVTGITSGSAIITATSEENSNKTYSCTYTINSPVGIIEEGMLEFGAWNSLTVPVKVVSSTEQRCPNPYIKLEGGGTYKITISDLSCISNANFQFYSEDKSVKISPNDLLAGTFSVTDKFSNGVFSFKLPSVANSSASQNYGVKIGYFNFRIISTNQNTTYKVEKISQ